MSSELHKAVILARGLGTRMRHSDDATALPPGQARAADAGIKAMIPFERPFLDYVLSGLADAGYRDICLIIGPEPSAIREHYAAQQLSRISLSYALQPEARGTADAVVAAETFVDGRQFVVMNSDNYYPVEALAALRTMGVPGTVLFDRAGLVRNSNIPAERIDKYAYADVSNGELLRLAEKPESGRQIEPGALVSMNLWRFSPAIFEHCRNVERSPRGEFELPAAVNRALQNGMRLRVERSGLGVLDLSQRADIAAVGERLRNLKVEL
jgi:dTDP-glucose pyrophosphorylase